MTLRSDIVWTERSDLITKYNQQFMRKAYCAAEDALLFSFPAQAPPLGEGAVKNKELAAGEGLEPG